MLAVGLVADGPVAAVRGLLQLQIHPARLLNDYTEIAGVGAAFLNATIVAIASLVLVRVFKVRLSGPTVAAVFTIFGFGLFGKTLLNVVPIAVGVAISAKIARKTFSEYILMALFGTALGPLISAIAFETGLAGPAAIVLAAVGGVIAGVLLPPVAISMLRLHQGFNLYNIGLTSGFIGVFAAAALVAGGALIEGALIWGESRDLVLILVVPVVSVGFLLAGTFGSGGKGWRDLAKIARLPGRLPTDFMSIVSVDGALINMGILGLLMWGLVFAIGGDFNGPVLGGIFTAIGFASFGKHPRNGWSPIAGVLLACLVYGVSPAAPGPILAALFVLTLAPLSGEFGPVVGIIAGFVHLTLVMRTGAWHLGVNLYNNGFAGGLTATLLVAVIQWFESSHDTNRFKRRREH